MRILWAAALICGVAAAQPRGVTTMSLIPGRPTDRSITMSVLAPEPLETYVEYGTRSGSYSAKTGPASVGSGVPLEITLEPLRPASRYYYRWNWRRKGEQTFRRSEEAVFRTQPRPGETFSFGVQGDSHPERRGRMFDAELYRIAMRNAAASGLDFYLTLGDDFNVDQLYNRGDLNERTVSQLYIDQRDFLGLLRTPVFLVNGNHEQAAFHLLNGKPDSVPAIVGRARNLYYPLPAPDRFYSGDAEPVEFVGLRRDYYAWTWGDALFVTIDPYWHSPVGIDAGIGGQAAARGEGKGERKRGEGKKGEGKGGGRNRDGWTQTMGDAQYRWLKKTLEESRAKYKFVFAHHVLGTGRGAVEMADLFEWGGRNRAGEWEFDKMRPGWELPVHQLMVKHGVTIFFQGHDHLFAKQEKDGVIYQETPNPADSTYTAFNREAYLSGHILPNAGFLRVTVSPGNAKVDYIRAWLPQDAKDGHANGEIAFSYTVSPRGAR